MREIYTIGHSNHTAERFVELLKLHAIQALADTRSRPYSRFAPQFNMKALRDVIERSRIRYVYLGAELGGKPADTRLYDARGRVDYTLISQSEAFRQGLSRLLKGIESWRIAVMWAEEDPRRCHRRRLITPALLEHGVEVLHIRGDGRIEPEADLAREEAPLHA